MEETPQPRVPSQGSVSHQCRGDRLRRQEKAPAALWSRGVRPVPSMGVRAAANAACSRVRLENRGFQSGLSPTPLGFQSGLPASRQYPAAQTAAPAWLRPPSLLSTELQPLVTFHVAVR